MQLKMIQGTSNGGGGREWWLKITEEGLILELAIFMRWFIWQAQQRKLIGVVGSSMYGRGKIFEGWFERREQSLTTSLRLYSKPI